METELTGLISAKNQEKEKKTTDKEEQQQKLSNLSAVG